MEFIFIAKRTERRPQSTKRINNECGEGKIETVRSHMFKFTECKYYSALVDANIKWRAFAAGTSTTSENANTQWTRREHIRSQHAHTNTFCSRVLLRSDGTRFIKIEYYRMKNIYACIFVDMKSSRRRRYHSNVYNCTHTTHVWNHIVNVLDGWLASTHYRLKTKI